MPRRPSKARFALEIAFLGTPRHAADARILTLNHLVQVRILVRQLERYLQNGVSTNRMTAVLSRFTPFATHALDQQSVEARQRRVSPFHRPPHLVLTHAKAAVASSTIRGFRLPVRDWVMLGR